MAETILYEVWLATSAQDSIKAGELAADGRRCAFRYQPEYLEREDAFALDPVNLPLKSGEQMLDRVLFGVFEDSLPDAWGRKLMAARFRLSHAEQSPHLLLRHLDDHAGGALTYRFPGEPPHTGHDEGIVTLGELADAARAFERGELHDDALLQRLFQSGASPGGAHPKVRVTDANGSPLLVKFSSVSDAYDVVGLEAASLELAAMCGLRVPRFTVLHSGGHKMLCLHRFDRLEGRPLHMISMYSLLVAEGFYHASYAQMADTIRMVSARPPEDLHALYRQMVFHAAIGNTDDHLKNFAMLHDGGYELSPAYDLLPNVNHNVAHVLSFLHGDIAPRRDEAIGPLAARFRIARATAGEIVDEVGGTVADNWAAVCRRHDVPADQVEHFLRQIRRHCENLGG